MGKCRQRRVVWSSDIGSLSQWKDYLEEQGLQHASEGQKYEACIGLNNDYFYDERLNLNIEIPEGIVVIADLGLWNGHRMGVMEVGTNLSNCLDTNTTGVPDGGEYCWYVDQYGNFRCKAIHHDGINQLVYRAWKPNISDIKKQMMHRELLQEKKYTSQIVGKYTVSLGKKVKDVYGWD